MTYLFRPGRVRDKVAGTYDQCQSIVAAGPIREFHEKFRAGGRAYVDGIVDGPAPYYVEDQDLLLVAKTFIREFPAITTSLRGAVQAQRRIVGHGQKALGVDGIDPADLTMDDLYKLTRELSTGNFQPQDLRQVTIGQSKKPRHLGLSAAPDKVVDTMQAEILHSVCDPVLLQKSVGSRRGAGAAFAFYLMDRLIKETGHRHILVADLKHAFPSIPHDIVRKALLAYFSDPAFADFVDSVMLMVERPGRQRAAGLKPWFGLGEGQATSSCLLDLVLHYCFNLILVAMAGDDRRVPISFLDDFALPVGGDEAGCQVLDCWKDVGSLSGITFHGSPKTRVMSLEKGAGAEWLGVGLYLADDGLHRRLPTSWVSDVHDLLQEVARRHAGMKARRPKEYLRKVRASLRGWLRYYAVTEDLEEHLNRICRLANNHVGRSAFCQRELFSYLDQDKELWAQTWSRFEKADRQEFIYALTPEDYEAGEEVLAEMQKVCGFSQMPVLMDGIAMSFLATPCPGE